jgi:pimeloyl-ACP methyl ester carboxylesterase
MLTRYAAECPTSHDVGEPEDTEVDTRQPYEKDDQAAAELHARGDAKHQGADLIIVGDGDIVTPEHAVEMFRTIPGAHLCVIPHAGHGVMPKETILTFLKEALTGEN